MAPQELSDRPDRMHKSAEMCAQSQVSRAASLNPTAAEGGL
jgi:hypothetical protein